MSQSANPTLIGAFVLGALLLVVVAMMALGGGFLFRERIELVTDFPGSVQGLNVGAQVQFQGVPIGQVTAISIAYLPQDQQFRIPVNYEIWPRNIRILGRAEGAVPRSVVRQLVARHGLRARLEPLSFVTGQYVIALNLNPGEPPQELIEREGAIRVPAMPATRDRLEEAFSSIRVGDLIERVNGVLDALQTVLESVSLTDIIVQLEQTLTEVQAVFGSLHQQLPELFTNTNQLVTHYTALAQQTQTQIASLGPQLEQVLNHINHISQRLDAELPQLTKNARLALTQTEATMRNLGEIAAAGSPTRRQIEELLRETTRAAQSLRTLADYLERHPEALVRGRRP